MQIAIYTEFKERKSIYSKGFTKRDESDLFM